MRRMLLTGVCLLGISACGLAPQKDGDPALTQTDHVLVDKIWDVKAGHFIDKAQLVEKVAQSQYLLLGETHDNPSDHRYQAEMIDALAANHRSAIVSFEMIDQKQGELLVGKTFDSSAALIKTLGQVKAANWDYEHYYRGVFDSVLKAGYKIYPASMGRDALMGVARHGEEHLPAETKALLAAAKLDEEQEAGSRQEIEASHCGMLQGPMVTAMMFTQRVKDAVMAESLMAHPDVDTRVLVAGSGHARTDRGVPLYLRQRVGDANILSIGWAEVAEGENDPQAYAERWSAKQLPFDYVWFTPGLERPDPCEGFRKHIQQKQDVKAEAGETK